MNTIWNELKLQDSISYYIGGGWGEDDYKEELKPAFVIRGTDMPYIRDGYYNEIPFRFHKVSNISKRILEENDIILEVSGGSKDQLVGRSIIVKKDLLNFLSPSAICASFCKLIRPDKNVVYPKFLYMWLRTIYSNGEIGKYQIQSTGISNFQFEAFIKHAKIQLPDLPTQKRIADVLSAYDDLIEKNNRRIALLEKAAQELYKEWFVRFRFPGYENVKFENGLPEGWEYIRFGNAIEIIDGDRGVNYPKQEEFYEEGECLFLNAGNVTKNGFEFSSCAYITKEKDQLLRKGKLQTDDVVLTTRGTVGNVAFLNETMTFSPMRINSGMVILRNLGVVSPEYIYTALRHESLQKAMMMYASGSAQPQLPIKDMRRIKIIKADAKTMDKFTKYVADIYKQVSLMIMKNQAISKQRDLLLPRLMSGKLEV